MPNPMTQEQLVDICRLMDINKDGLVDLNEFLESFRLAEKSLQDEDNEYTELEATWQKLDRRPSKTAVDRDETGVQVEILNLESNKKSDGRDKNGQSCLKGNEKSEEQDKNSNARLIMDDDVKSGERDQNGHAHLMGDSVPRVSQEMDDIQLIDCEDTPKRPGLLESDI